MILHLTTCNVAVGLFHHYFCLIVLGNGKIKRGKKTFETMKTKGRKKQKLNKNDSLLHHRTQATLLSLQ